MNVDFAIIGSTPKAAILACMLAKTHGHDVALIADFPSTLRPQHGFDISIAPITRPQTWNLLKENISQTKDFLHKTSNTNVIERVDPVFVATNKNGDIALSYMRNIALAFGFMSESQAISDRFISSYQFRDATRLLRRPFFTSLNARLDKCGVKTFSREKLKLKNIKKETQIILKEKKFFAKQIILADDRAIEEFLSPSEITKQFKTITTQGFLVEPTEKIKSSVMFNLDSGLIIHQRNNNSLDCLAPKTKISLEQKICQMTNKNQILRLAGKTQFSTLISQNDAPIIGKIARSKYISLASFGEVGLFLTPAIARYLDNNATSFEKQYFEDHAPKTSKNLRTNITEFSSTINYGRFK